MTLIANGPERSPSFTLADILSAQSADQLYKILATLATENKEDGQK